MPAVIAGARRCAMITFLCAVTVLVCTQGAFAAPPARDRAGVVHFAKSADSSFDRYSYAPTLASQQWMRDKYWRMRAYSPYFDTRTAWYANAWFYKDAYAIYPGEEIASTHPEWVLRDGAGSKLYIWYACGGGTCPQYSADIGSPEFRAHWIADAKASYNAGYRGIFVDDVNMELRISDGHGNLQWPVDPRTGRQMNQASWRRYMADFMEQIRAELPGAEIVHNSLWFDGDADPDIQRQLAAADLIEIERGVNDSGVRSGDGVVSLRTLFGFVDRRHAAGKGVILDASAPTLEGRLYGLAAYFLLSSGRDALGNNPGGTPDDWWKAYDSDLGEALGARYDLPGGLIRRDFTGGIVLLNEPDMATRTVAVGEGFKDLTGAVRTSVTLGPASGEVLVRTGAPPSAPGNTETTVITEPVPTATVTPTPTADPSPVPAPAATPAPATTSGAGQRRRASAGATTARVARVGARRVRISGRVNGARKGRVDLVLQRRHGRRWTTVRRLVASVSRDGRFAKTIKARAGRHRVQARFRGTRSAAPSRSTFRAFTAKV